jgi:hypothetical protein
VVVQQALAVSNQAIPGYNNTSAPPALSTHTIGSCKGFRPWSDHVPSQEQLVESVVGAREIHRRLSGHSGIANDGHDSCVFF